MKHIVQIKIPNFKIITLELDDTYSPNTVNNFLKNLPFTVDLNVWGDEIYTSQSPISQSEENAKSAVELNDVAYWPTGKAICLFYGPTPIGNPGEIIPASPVNVIGKIISPDKTILNDVHSERATFILAS
ncbi:MAG: cyclophilin-like fold protein [Nitrosopumilus sp.]|nr:cyclophilin-like fold protein [Nitrosopumilus sp.]MDH3489551.1 cyclophilin-like fold protein [Nitrosopumilus sp.]MDH3516549.1 cyclophilin-like fold protein [Nitrosopumilus sp.]MDH3565015.1 cyclophilin-like fold protein [Nitrosopumilus sp.]MDH5416438.1 cyclophilin-like fold protein [Nitrosopumilus sp.]